MRIQTRLFFLVLMCGSSAAMAQGSSNTVPWPSWPPVGIGTALSTPSTVQNALQIDYDSIADTHAKPAILRLSQTAPGNAGTTSIFFGTLGLMSATTCSPDTTYSNLSKLNDLVLHEQYGDLILADYKSQGGAIRLSTTPDPLTIPNPPPITPGKDLERMTILNNGNVGIDLPPDATTGLGIPLDQVQIGGGSIAPTGYTSPIPGLTIYGGNRWEGASKVGGGKIPVDWRGISFNH
ncbi:MAG TPA: hypothetical protein VG537_11830, partial [Candidatus Kapabacteria bacterium]|nr:hypothetical protein [Candidatus Kapabacteria bacterium]